MYMNIPYAQIPADESYETRETHLIYIYIWTGVRNNKQWNGRTLKKLETRKWETNERAKIARNQKREIDPPNKSARTTCAPRSLRWAASILKLTNVVNTIIVSFTFTCVTTWWLHRTNLPVRGGLREKSNLEARKRPQRSGGPRHFQRIPFRRGADWCYRRGWC